MNRGRSTVIYNLRSIIHRKVVFVSAGTPWRVGLLMAIGISILLLGSCENDMAKIKRMSSRENPSEETGQEVEIVYSDSGKIKARIIAPEVIKKNKDEVSTEFPKGLRLYIYNDSMKVESRLTANYGISYDRREELMVRDNVVIVNVEGKKLNSEELTWKKKEKKITSDKFVQITTKDEIIYGKGFESDENFDNYVIKQVTGTIMKESKDFNAEQ